MTNIEWKTPPEPAPVEPMAAEVSTALRANPGKWARIAQNQPAVMFWPWWSILATSDEFEVKYVPLDPQRRYGARDVYARFRPDPPSRGEIDPHPGIDDEAQP